jgi:membrane protein required for colicin V production
VNGFDILLLVLLGVLVVLGLVKGLTRLLIGIAALVCGFVLASQFHQQLGARMTWLNFGDDILKLIAYLAIFVGTLLAGGFVAWLVRKLLKAAMLSWADRLAGGALGLVAAALVAGWIVLPLVAYSPAGQTALRESVLAPYVVVVADVAKELVPQGLSDSYEEKIEDLRQYWRERWDAPPDSREARRSVPSRVA